MTVPENPTVNKKTSTFGEHVFVIVAMILGMLLVAVVCLTFWTVSQHNGDLKQISKNQTEIIQLENRQKMYHTSSAAKQKAICDAIPGCVLPKETNAPNALP